MKTIFCQKLQKEERALTYKPYPGAIGDKILANISQAGFDLWLKQQTMLLNEYRLNPMEPEHRKFLEQEMLKFLFPEGNA